MKPTEIREMTDDELLDRQDDLERAVFNLKIQFATGQLDSTSRLKMTRRDLARVKTIIKERGLKTG
jgi:large subunit ribosomal protein L29